MSKVYYDSAAEHEVNDVGKKYMHSSDIVDDMSRAYGALSPESGYTQAVPPRRQPTPAPERTAVEIPPIPGCRR